MLALMEQHCQMSSEEIAAFGSYQRMRYRSAAEQMFDVTRQKIESISCGKTVYHLIFPTIGSFTFKWGKPIEFAVQGFDWLVGKGSSSNEANQNWLDTFHSTFQQLYVMRPFEMSDEESQLWNNIQSKVDVQRYRLSQDLVVLQEGKVIQARPFPEVIEWEDGTRERVQLDKMPGEFAAYKSGQRFEAVIHRHPVTYKIRKVDYIKRLRELPKLSQDEERNLWESIPTSGSLPDASWE